VRSGATGVLGSAVLGSALVLTGCASSTPSSTGTTVNAGGGTSASSPSLPTVPAGGGTSGSSGNNAIPANVGSVEVSLTRTPDRQLAQRTLASAAATKLAAVVNALPHPKSGMVRCMTDSGKYDQLTFHSGTNAIQVQVKLDPCGSVKVTQGKSVPASYDGASTINAAVLSALGLPPNA
jgi:hypothetical protein